MTNFNMKMVVIFVMRKDIAYFFTSYNNKKVKYALWDYPDTFSFILVKCL